MSWFSLLTRSRPHLTEVMNQVAHVILDEEPESNRLIGADMTRDFELGGGQVSDYVSEIPIVTGPKCDQSRPGGFLDELHTNAAILVIAGKLQRTLQDSAYKSLVVVGSRINQMPEDLLA